MMINDFEPENPEFWTAFKDDPTKMTRMMNRRWKQYQAVAARAAQERRAREWDAFAKGGPCPPLSDAECARLMRDIFQKPDQ